MGLSLAWIGVRGLGYEQVLDRLALGVTEARAGYWSAPVSGRPARDGWVIIAAIGCAHRIVDPTSLATLSAGCEVVACSIEEHVMFCSAAQWSDGARVWEVVHESEQGDDHLATEGALPHDLAKLLAEKRNALNGSRDDDTDYAFDIPLDLAFSLTGFRHDGPLTPDDELFTVLHDGMPPKPWWKFWQ
ncbi:hypothetical protein [Massilia sp. CF038]|uniref:hypothetical protein n=1 Tax=Massilia sp. CF038 TaxID=1881045 RepID=UPI000911088B|nr:hypothetical protein [Massilia sp. CF038]SHH50717.1 hypothetical protein SAMN05428948_4206 [Massilia sp. CF038]